MAGASSPDVPLETVVRSPNLLHPARVARFCYREMLACDPHRIDQLQRCTKCGAPFWAVGVPEPQPEDPRKVG